MHSTIRGSGRTYRQIASAKEHAVFIWCSDMLELPRRIANSLNRKDILILGSSSLHSPDKFRNMEYSEVILDHDLWLRLSNQQYKNYVMLNYAAREKPKASSYALPK